MFGVINYGTYAAGALLIVLLPGPNSMYVLSVAARKGVRTGFRGAIGVFTGDTTLIVLTSIGAASLLRATPLVFDGVKIIGAAYLLYIGYGMLKTARELWRGRNDESGPAAGELGGAEPALAVEAGAVEAGGAGPVLTAGAASEPVTAVATVSAVEVTADAAPVPAEGRERPYRRALVISLLNPKAILFLLSFFVQFVDPGYGKPAVSFVILGATLQLFSVLYLTTLILAGTALANAFRRRRRLSAGLTAGVAALFVGFAAKLATASVG